jgi:hypothetical protein
MIEIFFCEDESDPKLSGFKGTNNSFREDALEIHHKFKKTVKIEYESVFNYDSTVKDSFINIFQSNSVKVYYTVETKKRVTLCSPKDVSSFVDTLKWNCPEFWEDSTKRSGLEVFFKSKNKQ